MSSVDRDPETLELFVEESLEGLTRAERLLLEAERGAPAPNLISTLFRDFHTIKGTSGFLSLPRILALAHAAEDLMGELRDGGKTARAEHFTVLMSVVDQLRTMIEELKETGDEGETDIAPLVRSLRDLMAAEASASLAPKLGEILVAKKAVSPDALAYALEAQEKGKPKLGDVLVERSLVSEAQVSEALDEQREAKKQQKQSAGDSADGTVRVSVGLLDRLVNLIGELVLARNEIHQTLRTNRDTSQAAQTACQRLSLVTSELQEQVMKTRMQPMARVFERIPRMVRDLAGATGKHVDCHIDGNATEIDKALVEAVRDPIMHMIRNSLDHGIETPEERAATRKSRVANLWVRAAHEGGSVIIEIEDDGRGMDPKKLRASAVRKGILDPERAEALSDREALHLVFRPGFSTAEKVSDISGRGVGMDVVRTHVERAGGQVELDSRVGRGTTVRLRMPLTLAIIPALLVRTAGQRFAIPQVNLLELVHLDEESASKGLETVRGAPVYRLRGEVLPLVWLADVLGLARRGSTGVNIVVVGVGGQRYGLVVDEIHDTEEIVVKPLHGALRRLEAYAGATVLGDGGVALIVEVAGIAAMAGIRAAAEPVAVDTSASAKRASGAIPHLVFTAGDATPCAVPLAMVSRLEKISASAIERVAGRELLQYRGEIVPVVRPERALELGQAPSREEQSLIVFDFGKTIGMTATEILDVVDMEVAPGADPPPFTHGRAVAFGRTTLVLDVYAIVRELAWRFSQDAPLEKTAPARVLVVEDSTSMRAGLAAYLRSRGLEIVEATDGAHALEVVAGCADTLCAVVTDLDMPNMNGHELTHALRGRYPTLPVVVFTSRRGAHLESQSLAAGACAHVSKENREALVTALAKSGLELPRSAA